MQLPSDFPVLIRAGQTIWLSETSHIRLNKNWPVCTKPKTCCWFKIFNFHQFQEKNTLIICKKRKRKRREQHSKRRPTWQHSRRCLALTRFVISVDISLTTRKNTDVNYAVHVPVGGPLLIWDKSDIWLSFHHCNNWTQEKEYFRIAWSIYYVLFSVSNLVDLSLFSNRTNLSVPCPSISNKWFGPSSNIWVDYLIRSRISIS